MVFEEQAFTRVILDFLRASAKDVEEIQSCWSKMRTCMNNMDETIESYQRERRAEEDMQDRLGTNFATAANVREESLIVKIRWFERKEDEAGSAYYQPELQDKDWPESYIWLISMRSPNINTLMPFDKMPFSNCVHRVHRDSTNLERQKFRLDVNKIRSCQQLIQRDLAALTLIFS